MNKEVIQRIGDMAGEIAKGYAERNVPQEQLSGGMSRNITDLIVNQIIKALSGAGIGGGGGGGGGGAGEAVEAGRVAVELERVVVEAAAVAEPVAVVVVVVGVDLASIEEISTRTNNKSTLKMLFSIERADSEVFHVKQKKIHHGGRVGPIDPGGDRYYIQIDKPIHR